MERKIHEIPVVPEGTGARPRVRHSDDPLAASAPHEAAPPPGAPPVMPAPGATAAPPPAPGATPPPPQAASPYDTAPPPFSAPAPPSATFAAGASPSSTAFAAAPPPPNFAAPAASAPAPAATTAPPPAASPTPAFTPSPTIEEQLASVFDQAGSGARRQNIVEPDRFDPHASHEPVVEPVPALTDNPLEDLRAALASVLPSRGSDLHLAADAVPLVRVDGALRPIEGGSVWSSEHVEGALRAMAGKERWAQFESEMELDLAYTLSPEERFRVNMYRQREKTGAAFRLIPTEIKQLAELGVPDVVGRFAKLPRGLVLVTGPTGSGKSTTLAALIDLVNRTRTDHIVTVEDPIEFLHSNKKSLVNQREVGPDTVSFNSALKHVLRQDPDVILIGELRDLETISVALTAAETGHLVFATLHTQDAPQTIDRVIDVFPAHQQPQVRAQLAATLQGVVCQTLIKRASGRGRIVATEIMTMTPAIANLIREGKTYQIHSAMQAGRDDGMHTMDQELADLVDSGKITHASAMARAQDVESLKQLIHRADPNAGNAGGH